MRARYGVLRMKKLFKIKIKKLYIDRSHISKGGGGGGGGFAIAQLTRGRVTADAGRDTCAFNDTHVRSRGTS